ncbi:GCG_CRPN prefix-to-repeats domain-containing protein [Methylobacterium gnaphalii]|uniref:Uncharacterized protein n=1 Tax=Methylobacterium gnaphalii TaxID=1010610 RepID=A0A512JP06_9HYPH|nr:hypothetical protein [Methylobacterium gnaphalii]GEP11672.1 hypothetical protein MGN01_35170 [Methylobacterium gnaphalii]GJD71352.1 hypothetical protein MMMDOFMJ_4308 [Methylobacterium gnaphalii]GLS50170.1 hypothetical protein GCM10007885_30220 [Methylobacterium gnaphalii]
MTRLKWLGLAAALVGSLGFASAASAAPIPLSPVGGDALIEHVAGGCGPGFHPNPWGVCRPNFYGPRPFYGRPIYRPYAYYRPRPYHRHW